MTFLGTYSHTTFWARFVLFSVLTKRSHSEARLVASSSSTRMEADRASGSASRGISNQPSEISARVAAFAPTDGVAATLPRSLDAPPAPLDRHQ
jgi:hypothetical protein